MWQDGEYRHKRKSNEVKNRIQIDYQVRLNQEQLDTMIKLLEMAESDIQRTFKRMKSDDMDMKEIYYYYRYHGRMLRRLLREVRGY